MPETRFFTISDSKFFVGTVALLNSLRVTGHEQDLVILDGGLSPAQRAMLEPHVTMLRLPDRPEDRRLLKPYPARFDPEEIVVLVDSDMIVTGTLEPILARAASGKICLFPDHPSDALRWFAEWHDVFDLAAPLRRQPYLNSGFVVVSTQHWPSLLQRWWQACEQIAARRALVGDPRWEPVDQADQDALNALLMSEVPADAVEMLPAYEWDLRRVAVEDARTLACVADGRRQPLLHTPAMPKHWHAGGWRRVEKGAYVELLRRLLFAPDVPITLAPSEVPLWLRPGALPRATLRAMSAYNRLPWVRRKISRIPHRALRESRAAFTRFLSAIGR